MLEVGSRDGCSFHITSNISSTSIAGLRNIGDFIFIDIRGTTISVHTSVETLVIVELHCVGLGSVENWTTVGVDLSADIISGGAFLLSHETETLLELSVSDVSDSGRCLDLSEDQVNIGGSEFLV